MNKKNALREKSYAFSIRIVKLCRFLREEKHEYILSKQVVRSGTSIGANIEEATGAQSDNDFIAKLHIALKEARETHYWIRLLGDCDYLYAEQSKNLLTDLDEVIALLTSSLKTLKTKDKKILNS